MKTSAKYFILAVGP